MPTLLSLLDQIDDETLLLPEFQRGYVWNRDQVRGLFRSLYLGYPVGSLLTWEADAATTKMRGSGTNVGIRKILLDGQQRLTSLYGVIRGEPPAFFEGRAETFTGLHFDADTEVFEFYAPAKMKGAPNWFNVSQVFTNGLDDALLDRLELEEDRNYRRARLARLNKLLQIRDRQFHVEVLTGQDKTIDVVVDVFNRLNSGGTKLSKGDLALARISAQSPEARKRMRGALAKWGSAGYGFTLEWLLRNVNVVATGRAPFSALSRTSADTFDLALSRSCDYIDSILNTIAGRLGMDHGNVLISRYAIPVLTAYLHGQGGRFPNHVEQSKALYWYVHAGLWGRYAGSTETYLARDLEILSEGGLNGLIAELANARGGTLRIRDEDFQGSTLGARFYPLLYTMTRMGEARDLGSGLPLRMQLLGRKSSLEVHHVIPKARLYERADLQFTRAEVNAVANFSFLTKDSNLVISAKSPQQYLTEVTEKHPGALESQWIPLDRELWRVERYREFLAERRRLLAESANDLLNQLHSGIYSRQPDLPRTGTSESVDDFEGDPAFSAALARLDELGMSRPQVNVEMTDPDTGGPLVVADALWPEGLQTGRGAPVLLEMDDHSHLPRLEKLGYMIFTSPEALVAYAENEARVDAGEADATSQAGTDGYAVAVTTS